MGHNILLIIMDVLVKKNNYNAPSIKVVSFKVEEGFQATLKIGIKPTSAGTETYDSESWAARPFQSSQTTQE